MTHIEGTYWFSIDKAYNDDFIRIVVYEKSFSKSFFGRFKDVFTEIGFGLWKPDNSPYTAYKPTIEEEARWILDKSPSPWKRNAFAKYGSDKHPIDMS